MCRQFIERSQIRGGLIRVPVEQPSLLGGQLCISLSLGPCIMASNGSAPTPVIKFIMPKSTQISGVNNF